MYFISESKKNREKAVPIFHKFLRIFDPRGRFYMLLALQDTVKEPGFVGYLATRTKDFVAESLYTKNSEELKYFTGKCLRDLIKKFCRLEGGCETDLVRNSDLIISSLNLLRYLIIRDTENFTGFLELLPSLDNNYLSPLKKAIQMSRAHYELQKKEINQPSNTDGVKTSTTVSVGGMELPHLSSEQKFQVIDGALNMFDLIDSLLSRLIECIHDHKTL
uniref:Glomulin-like protein isoform x1 n=1 Tax=Triatoma infestans TaxID=30076 RepID=A0A161MMT7_TRIIF